MHNKTKIFVLLVFLATLTAIAGSAFGAAPVRSNGMPSGELDYGTAQTVMSLNTDNISTCKFSTEPNTEYSQMVFSFTTTASTYHAIVVATETGGSYTYYVRCTKGWETNIDDYVISFSVAAENPCQPNELICDGNCFVPECASDLDCPEVAGHRWICLNPNFCDAVCDANGTCEPGCITNSECDDGDEFTTDICDGAGTCNASCTNVSCSAECDSDNDCDDSMEETTDSCVSPGSCDSYCDNSCESVECAADGDCDDSNSSTTDSCIGAGTCSAYCENIVADANISCSSAGDCDDSNSLTTDVCVNAGTEDSDCTNEACTIECSADSACDDSNSSTTDTCTNQGTCDSSCVNLADDCEVECISDTGCDDSNSSTTDLCLNPGECNSSCIHNAVDVGVSCAGNDDCDDSNTLTTDSCVNAGTEDSYCASIALLCDSACLRNLDCDDSNPLTTDDCVNPGSCDAYCTNTQCAIACYNDSECADSDSLTTDSCINAGTCAAACANTSCNPACSTDSDCDDSDSLTTDACAGAGRCSAVCISMTSCGNGTCEPSLDESECSCPSDCGSCFEVLSGTCREKNCIGKNCTATISFGCCGNGICELTEDYSNCSEDCKPKNVTFELIGYDEQETHVRGEKVLLKASVVADTIELTDAEITATGFFGKLELKNDGKHEDGGSRDNIYGEYFVIENTRAEGDYTITFSVDAAGSKREYTKTFRVKPKLNLVLTLNKEIYFLSDNIQINGTLKRKGESMNIPIDFKLTNPRETLIDGNIMPVSGSYTFSYKTATIQEAGTWKIELEVEDGNNNSAIIIKEFDVLEPGTVVSLEVSAEVADANLARGKELEVIISVKDTSGFVDADVAVEAFGKRFNAEKTSTGNYTAKIIVDFSAPIGENVIKVFADKSEDGVSYSGIATASFEAIGTELTMEIVEPLDEHYSVGDTVSVKVKLLYPDGAEVENAKITMTIGTQEVTLEAKESGIYSADYVVNAEDSGVLNIKFNVADSYGNTATGSVESDVSGYSFMFYVREYGLPAGLLIIAAVIVLLKLQSSTIRRIRTNMLLKREKQVLEIIKGLQYQYFKEASTDKKTYLHEVEKYEEELKKLKQNIGILEGKIKK